MSRLTSDDRCTSMRAQGTAAAVGQPVLSTCVTHSVFAFAHTLLIPPPSLNFTCLHVSHKKWGPAHLCALPDAWSISLN